MKVIALIPARYNASRFPGKLMAMLDGEAVILKTYRAAKSTGLFEEVYVVTDSDVIYDLITAHNGKAIMSKKEHECGSDRIAEAAETLEADVFINVQGDEPFIKKEPLEKVIQVFKSDPEKQVDVASIMQEVKDEARIKDPNCVKVVVDNNSNALLFSRSPIPYFSDSSSERSTYRHIGVYAFRKSALLAFHRAPMTRLEKIEKIEALRHLEIGNKMRMVESEGMGVAIDSPEDLERAKAYLAQKDH